MLPPAVSVALPPDDPTGPDSTTAPASPSDNDPPHATTPGYTVPPWPDITVNTPPDAVLPNENEPVAPYPNPAVPRFVTDEPVKTTFPVTAAPVDQ